MCGLAQERDAPARLVLLDPAERHTKAVLQRYPLDMPLEAVRDHPSVISAGRLRVVRDRAPTRQVLVELIGAAPDRLDLGPWGKYSLRHYDREPLRCYRCQRYNHLQGRCQHPVRCGVCSQAHPSEQCIRRHKARQLTTARCPNCFGGHHAWNPRCPERLRRLPGGGRRLQGGGDRPGPQGSFVPAPPPTRPAWGGAGALDTDAEGSRGLASLFHIPDTQSSRGTVDHDRPIQRQRRRWKVQARAHHSLGQEAAGPHPSPTPATLSPPMPMPVTVSPVPTPSAALPPLPHTGARVTHSSQTHRFHATRSYAHARSGVGLCIPRRRPRPPPHFLGPESRPPPPLTQCQVLSPFCPDCIVADCSGCCDEW
ncbi:hypothetical protein GWK47_017257 [Chionoecetes opilio]|uniref:Gag-like protein n=1 Tax=Chionoecetes opilio TaxID=41210 RepID=A0A8J4Y0D2_CHIOP|nr:hypothetical protein GWK47_017257 [Chionoecetes opilio]